MEIPGYNSLSTKALRDLRLMGNNISLARKPSAIMGCINLPPWAAEELLISARSYQHGGDTYGLASSPSLESPFG